MVDSPSHAEAGGVVTQRPEGGRRGGCQAPMPAGRGGGGRKRKKAGEGGGLVGAAEAGMRLRCAATLGQWLRFGPEIWQKGNAGKQCHVLLTLLTLHLVLSSLSRLALTSAHSQTPLPPPRGGGEWGRVIE